MKGKLRLALILILTLVLALPSVGAQAAYYPSFGLRVLNSAGTGAFYDDVAVEVTGHKMYAYVTELSYAGSRPTIKWTSSRSSVASVSSKGVITCKKAGATNIRVKITNRSNRLYRWQQFPVLVLSNSASYTGMPQIFMEAADQAKAVAGMSKKVYQKDGKVHSQFYVYNGTDKTIKKSVKLEMSITFDVSAPSVQFTDLGVRKVSLESAIPPHSWSTSKAVNLGKPCGFNAKLDFLLTACVIAASPTTAKGAGGAPMVKSLVKLPRFAVAHMLEQQPQPFSPQGGAASPEGSMSR